MRVLSSIALMTVLLAGLLIAGCADKTESTVVTVPTATPTATATPAPSPVPSPTSTPSPTPTPRPTAAPTSTPSPTPTATPTPEPSLATAKAAALLVTTLGVPSSTVMFESVKPMQWPNTALGCPEPGKAYAEVIVPGWIIIVRQDSKLYEYHADREGDRVITCDPKLVRTYGTVNLAQAHQLVNVSKVRILAIGLSGGSPVAALEINNPAEIGAIVASLQADLPLYDQKPCGTLLQIEFVMGSRVESLHYACNGDGTVLRSQSEGARGRETRAPAEFQKRINEALANRPFPSTPPEK